MSTWRTVWCDYAARPIGEVAPTELKFNTVLNGPSTIEFTVPIEDTLGPQIAFPTNGLGVVKLYQDNVIRGVFETTSIQLKGTTQGDTVGVTAVDMLTTVLSSAFFLGGAAGSRLVIPAVPTARDTVAEAAAYVVEYNETLRFAYASAGPILHLGTIASGSGTYVTSTFDASSSVLQIVQDLAFRASGFDFWVPPVEPVLASGGDPDRWGYGQFNAAALRGSAKPNVVFEYRVGRNNVNEYTNTYLAGEHLCTLAAVRNPSTRKMIWGTAGGIEDFGPRMRLVDTEFTEDALFTGIRDEHLARRGFPRQVFTFQPAGEDNTWRVPVPFVDYDLGDRITARAALPQGTTVVNGAVRVYGIEVSIDKDGRDTVNLNLTPETT